MLWNDQRRRMLEVAKRDYAADAHALALGDQRRMKHDGAKSDCAADACMLAHGPHPKRVARAALNSAKDLKYFDGLTPEMSRVRQHVGSIDQLGFGATSSAKRLL